MPTDDDSNDNDSDSEESDNDSEGSRPRASTDDYLSTDNQKGTIQRRIRKRAQTTTPRGQPVVQQTKVVNVGGQEITVRCPNALQLAATVDKTLQRKEKRAQWWGDEIEDCLLIVNPGLAGNKWKEINLAHQAEILQENLLMPLLLGNPEAGYSGAFVVKVVDDLGVATESMMQPGTITNKISDLEFFFQSEYDENFSFGKGSIFAQGHGAVLIALQKRVALERLGE